MFSEPPHELPEAFPLVLERVPAQRLVTVATQPLYLSRARRAQAFERTNVAGCVVHADLDAVLAEVAVGAVSSCVGGDYDRPSGHRLEAWHVETLLHQRRGEEHVCPVVELAQLGPADRVPDHAKLEPRRARERGRDFIADAGLPRRVPDLDRGAKTATSLPGEEVRVIAKLDDLGDRGLVQVRLYRLEDHVVGHDPGHRARE